MAEPAGAKYAPIGIWSQLRPFIKDVDELPDLIQERNFMSEVSPG